MVTLMVFNPDTERGILLDDVAKQCNQAISTETEVIPDHDIKLPRVLRDSITAKWTIIDM